MEATSIRNLYQKRLEKYLTETITKDDIKEELKSIEMCIGKSANEVIGKKKIQKKEGTKNME